MNLKMKEKYIVWGSAIAFWFSLSAYMLVLPPYEGFDEIAHYSYISFISDSWQVPVLGLASIDKTMENQRNGLPKPYTTTPPYENNGGITYKDFFVKLSSDERREIVDRFWLIEAKAEFRPMAEAEWNKEVFPSIEAYNWQAQHPPLFYVLMSLPYHYASEWSAGARLTWLRLVSIVLAGGSAVFWLLSVRVVQGPSRRYVILGGLIILLFPSLFFDLARLGNDGLAAFLFAGVFYFMLACAYQDVNRRLPNLICLSFLLGLGLLTKMFFLPIAFGVICFYVWLCCFGEKKLEWKSLINHLFVASIIMMTISGWWFIQSLDRYGVFLLSDEMLDFKLNYEPIGYGLNVLSFIFQLLKNFLGFCSSFIWSGTQSWIPRYPLTNLLWVPLFLLFLLGFVRLFKSKNPDKQFWFACMFTLVPVLLGFFYHMYTRVKFTGIGSGTGGYYLFVVWPVLGCLAALCFDGVKSAWARYSLIVAFGLVVLFDVGGWWLLMQIFGGVVEKTGEINRGIGNLEPTFYNFKLLLGRMDVLAFPSISNILYITATIIKFVLLVIVACVSNLINENLNMEVDM